MKLKILLATALFLFGCVYSTDGQQDAMFTRYMFVSNMFFNPASTARTEGTLVTLAYRNQWVQVEGAPTTFSLTVEKRSTDGNAGFGLNVFHDKIGFDANSGLFVNYAYGIKLNKSWTASIGIKGGVQLITSYFANAITPNPTTLDPLHAQDPRRWLPRLGAGIFIDNQKTFLGFSIPNISTIYQSKIFFQEDDAILSRHFYFTAGHVFGNDTDDFNFKPSIFVKYQKAAPIQLDFSLQCWYQNLLSMGLSYRTGDAISALLDVQAMDGLIVSYAYDLTTSRFRVFAGGGSHEVILAYTLPNSKVRVPSIHKFSKLSRF